MRPWYCGGQQRWMAWGLALALMTLATGCRSSPDILPEASTATHQGEPAQAGVVPESPVEETIDGFKATVIDPPRATRLETQRLGAEVNLRSQPTTLSPIVARGQSGDPVRLLRLAEGEGGYSWYYVQFTQSDSEGWVRGDFVDAAGVAVAAPTAQPVVATLPQPCGGDRQEAHFETQSFAIYLCNTPKGLRYISTNKTTQAALITDDVASNQGLYIAIDGDQQYHVSDTALAIYQVNNGSYSQLKGEPVLRFERFMY